MKFNLLFHSYIAIGMLAILFANCKKKGLVEIEPIPEEKNIYSRDSIHFEVGGHNYSSNYIYRSFTINSGPNLKYLSATKPGLKQWIHEAKCATRTSKRNTILLIHAYISA